MVTVSGIGSWPGVRIDDALRMCWDSLPIDHGHAIPYLVELPQRGPGADMIGRTAAFLAGMYLDLQPFGWRLVPRSGRDDGRARSYLRQDLDALAEVAEGYQGPLKLQVTGPWTACAHTHLALGEPTLADAGACRDLAQSLTEGIREALGWVRRAVPGAELVVQLDEPSLPVVLAGGVPTASGLNRIAPVDPQVAGATVARMVAEVGAPVVVHCCAEDVPFALLRQCGVAAMAVDTSLLTPRTWESVAANVEDGVALWAGMRLPMTAAQEGGANGALDGAAAASELLTAWRRVGLEVHRLRDVVLTPTCGLAQESPQVAIGTQRMLREVADRLLEASEQ